MAGSGSIWVNGYEWKDVTSVTTPGRVYTEEEVRAAGGNPRYFTVKTDYTR